MKYCDIVKSRTPKTTRLGVRGEIHPEADLLICYVTRSFYCLTCILASNLFKEYNNYYEFYSCDLIYDIFEKVRPNASATKRGGRKTTTTASGQFKVYPHIAIYIVYIQLYFFSKKNRYVLVQVTVCHRPQI